MNQSEQLRALPAVHEILARLPADLLACFPHAVAVEEIRRAIEAARRAVRDGASPGGEIETRVCESLAALARPSLRHVINATGVVLHTNLGRAPLGNIDVPAGYSNLEYDLNAGRRGKRDAHTAALLERLLGAPAIAVNNNAAAVFLALNELAAGFEVVVSRGELIEIGDGFRIPEIMQRSGAILREVGTTNRTRLEDYRAAISDRTRLLLRVHPSNFRMLGFTARPELDDLTALGRERGIPVYEDLGSGYIGGLDQADLDEPAASASLRAGANLVSFSGDKLLGGPQAGILAGEPQLVARLRRNPLFRALRLDKIILQALEGTLRNLLLQRWDAIPALHMIRQSADAVRERAARLLAASGLPGEIIEGLSVIGGGATPERSIPTWLIALRGEKIVAWERRLRTGEPPVIARIEQDRLLFDLRTVFADEEAALVARLQALS